MKRLIEPIDLPRNGPLAGADTPDYAQWFVCSTGDHALFPVQEQGTSAADNRKLRPNVVFYPSGSRKGLTEDAVSFVE